MFFWKAKTDHFDEAKTAQRAMPIFLTMLLAAALFIGTKYLLGILTESLYNYISMQVALLRMDPEAPILQDIGMLIRASGLGILLVLAVLYVRFLEGRRVRSMGLHRKGMGKALLLGVLIGALVFAAVLAVLLFLGSIRFEGEVQTAPGVRILCFLSVLLCGVSFEIYFRGFVLSSLGARCRVLIAVLLTAVLSTAAHAYYWGFSYHSVVNNLLLDLCLGLLAVRTGNTWTACATRSAYLLICQFIFGAVHSGGSYAHALVPATLDYGSTWVGTANGIDSGSTLTIILAVILVLALFLPKRMPKEEEQPRRFMEHVPADREKSDGSSADEAAPQREESAVLRRPESLKKPMPEAEEEPAAEPNVPDGADDEEWEEEETRVHVEPDYKKPEDYLK